MNRHVTVAHVLGSVDRGGVEVRTLELQRALVSRDLETFMVTLSGRRGALAEEYEEAGARIVPMRLGRLDFPLRFVTFLRRNKVDAVHSHVYLASGFVLALARLAGVPNRIAHFQSDGPSHSRLGTLRRASYAIMRKLIRAHATAIVGASPSSLEAWSPNWKSDVRSSVLLHGFDLDRFVGTSGETFVRSIGVSADDQVILHLGRADFATKNRDGAIEIFARYAEAYERGVLVFVGRDGNGAEQSAANRQRWERRLDELALRNRVLFTQERDDIPDVLAAADVLLFTSTSEGMPGVVVEARAAGVPVVSSDLPGCLVIASIIDGVACVSLDEDHDVWVDALSHALALDTSGGARERARERVAASDFNVNTAAGKYWDLWTRY